MIYQPAEDSYLLQKYVEKFALGRVLDVGTGSGIQALTAIKNPNVREVIAIDINEEAIVELNKTITDKELRKIKAIQSDLFENVNNHFNTIVFNPPYLPEDEREDSESQLATTGGKHGWEISEKFFKNVSKFLFADGGILFLFSSLTGKDKINQIIKENLFEAEELGNEELPLHEKLYVYKVTKGKLLRKLESKLLENVSYLTHGKRGDIFTGYLDKSKLIKTHLPSKKDVVKVAIKVEREESKAQGRISNEIYWLRRLNKEVVGPRLLFFDTEFGIPYLVYEFVEGEEILDWIKHENKETIREVLLAVLQQCYVMDQIGVNKEEMHHPHKHIIINKNNTPTLLDAKKSKISGISKTTKAVLIDFERCSRTEKPHNVTQFVEFICRMKDELEKKGFIINVEGLRELAKAYKDSEGKEFDGLLRAID